MNIILFMAMSISVSSILLMSSHPVAIMALILIQTITLCMILWGVMKISWFSFILFLIFLGGLMVLFVYISSLASNEKFEMSYYEAKFTMLCAGTLFSMFMYLQFFYKQVSTTSIPISESMKILFSSTSLFTTMMIITYLLLTLLVVVVIASMYEGPLRNLLFK